MSPVLAGIVAPFDNDVSIETAARAPAPVKEDFLATQDGDNSPNDSTQIIDTAEDISRLAFGYMASKALFSALHLDLFQRLTDGPKAAETLAEETGTRLEALRTLMTALSVSGLVTFEDGTYANAPAADIFLVPGQPYYFGDYLRYQIDRQMFPVMQHLNEVLDGEYDRAFFSDYEGLMADEEEARLFSDSQHAGSVGPARTLNRKVDLTAAESLLDIGGGSGAFAITLCQENPGLSATVLDFPNVAPVAQRFIDEAALSDRVAFQGGNALTEPWPEGQDAVLMSYLLSGVGGEHLDDLLSGALRVLKPGGVLMIHDFIIDDDRHGPYLTALWQLQHLVFTPGAKSLAPGDIRPGMEAAGFTNIKVDALIPGMTKLIVGYKAA